MMDWPGRPGKAECLCGRITPCPTHDIPKTETIETTKKRYKVIHIRVSPSELQAINDAACVARLTVAEYVRKSALKKEKENGLDS